MAGYHRGTVAPQGAGWRRSWAAALLLLCAACGGRQVEVDSHEASHPEIRTGAGVLAARGFDAFAGKRIGLIANHTSLVGTEHLADLLYRAPGVRLTALFGPEHGIRGDAVAGEAIRDGRDSATGVPVYSLYGAQRKPSPEQLADLDALVFDIQDVGARFYTYISTMGLAMEAAAEAGLPFYVLDRPNPLGGTQIEGYIREEAFTSFVGQFPVPVTHGMTVGELALMIEGEGWIDGADELALEVVPMVGWRRAMLWEDTGLEWIPTSPNIPDVETALVYPGACFFEAVQASEGRGTYMPFKQVGAAWADAAALADTLNARALPGVRFEAVTFMPVSIPRMAVNPRFEGVPQHGIRFIVTEAAAFRPVATGIHALHAFYTMAAPAVRGDFINERWMNLLSGTRRLGEQLASGVPADTIVADWEDDVAAFADRRFPYLIYE